MLVGPKAMAMKKYKIMVCRGPECGDKRHSADVHAAFERELKSCPLGGNEATLDRYSCFGKCTRGVNVLVREIVAGESPIMVSMMPNSGKTAFLYHLVSPTEARKIIEEHVAGGRPLVEFIKRGVPPSHENEEAQLAAQASGAKK